MVKIKKLLVVGVCCSYMLLGQAQLPVSEYIYNVVLLGIIGPKE